MTLPAYVNSEADIRAAALKLLRAELPIQVRLMGLRMSNFLQLTIPHGQKSLASFFQPKEAGMILTASNSLHQGPYTAYMLVADQNLPSFPSLSVSLCSDLEGSKRFRATLTTI